MDGDSTTIAKIHTEISGDIVKKKDKNHTKKGFADKLYKLRDAKGHKQLSTKVINYLQKCLSYVLAQHCGNIDGIRKNLTAIVPHAFGSHEHCDMSWCQYLTDPVNYKHKSLPYGKDLVGDDLREDLNNVMDVYINNAEGLSKIGSTQANENMNMIIASKAPKARHYSASDSFNFRVAAAVAQKNLGHTYICQVC